ncbi:MAG: hypothetical protein ACREQ4_12885 [Candidatus Binataceae bacterium]
MPITNSYSRLRLTLPGACCFTGGTRLLTLAGLLCLALSPFIGGCSTKTPMQVDVTQLAPYVHAAKGPDCQMPVLEHMPAGDIQQIAIVEAWADLKDNTKNVLPALRSKACETGADALVIINSDHQDIKHLLYGATPNETMNKVTSENGYSDPGSYIRAVEHTRRIGEAGHNGFYIDAVAVEYSKPGNKVGVETSSPPTPPNG